MGRARASEIWKEIKPLIGEMITVCNESETRLEKEVKEAYQRGLEDMLVAAKILAVRGHDEDIDALFGHRNMFCIFQDFSPQEIITMIREHEEKRHLEERAPMFGYRCPECGGLMCGVSTASIPPVIRYECPACGYKSRPVREALQTEVLPEWMREKKQGEKAAGPDTEVWVSL